MLVLVLVMMVTLWLMVQRLGNQLKANKNITANPFGFLDALSATTIPIFRKTLYTLIVTDYAIGVLVHRMKSVLNINKELSYFCDMYFRLLSFQ